jgi:hypothetical protein
MFKERADDADQSVYSKTTHNTLGKRERRNTQNEQDLNSSFERPVIKRARVSSKVPNSQACVSNASTDKPQARTAPTSMNGSKNLSPELDLNVQLQQGKELTEQ